jgi:hypothetical protein
MNPWEDMFNAWLTALSPTQEQKMKKYEVTFQTIATVVVEVDAQDSDTALEYAWDYLDQNDAEFGEWECINVDRA